MSGPIDKKNKKNTLVEPRTLNGFQDRFPEEVAFRRWVMRRVEEVFERYGFVPLETPALEHLDVLLGTGGEGVNKELFRLETPEAEPVALRFDLTVPFARMLAQYPDQLKPPFRRYAMGSVWRADKPGPGRFREFTQCDIDVAGSPVIATDAEVIAVLSESLRAISIPGFRILVNNRKLIDALLEHCGISDAARQKHVLRVIDKLAKVGLENVQLELGPGRVDASGDPIPGVQLDEGTIDKILRFIDISGADRRGVTAALCRALPQTPLAGAAVAEMEELAEALDALGVSEAHAKFAPSLARGLDYYTGPVFEVALPNAPQFGSVGGGGRYDGLVSRFSKVPVQGTGASLGIDRLIPAMRALGLGAIPSPAAQVLVVTMGNVPRSETLRLAAELRAANVRTETFFASRKKMQMGNQLSHADHYGIPVAVIIGEDELAQGVVSVKNLVEGKAERADIDDREAYREAGKVGQVTVKRTDLVGAVKFILHSL